MFEGSVDAEILNSQDDYFLVEFKGISSPSDYSSDHWFNSIEQGIEIVNTLSKRFDWIFVDSKSEI